MHLAFNHFNGVVDAPQNKMQTADDLQVTYSGSGELGAGEVTSAYTLEFDGECAVKDFMLQSA